MNKIKNEDFKTEWCLLQNQFDSYEKHSLYLKIVGIISLVATTLLSLPVFLSALLLLIIWFQDAIWKTFQARIEQRLLQVEDYIASDSDESAFQFNNEFLRVRATGLSLIGEYIRQSIRPTVAFPHALLILIAFVV